MLKSTGLVLTAAGLVVANEVIFAPMLDTGSGNPKDIPSAFNWRIVPATAILSLTLGGLEKLSEPLGKGLAGLILLYVLVVPVGNAQSVLENAGKVMSGLGHAIGPGAIPGKGGILPTKSGKKNPIGTSGNPFGLKVFRTPAPARVNPGPIGRQPTINNPGPGTPV